METRAKGGCLGSGAGAPSDPSHHQPLLLRALLIPLCVDAHVYEVAAMASCEETLGAEAFFFLRFEFPLVVKSAEQ